MEAEQGLTQRQATGDLVEIPGFAVRFAAEAPWRPIQSLKARLEGRDPCEPNAEIPCEHQRDLFGSGPIADPHWYVILQWASVDSDDFWGFARVIERLGYRSQYIRPYNPRPLINDYLEIGEFVYWHVYPQQMCRTRREWQQHELLPVQRQPPSDDGRKAAT